MIKNVLMQAIKDSKFSHKSLLAPLHACMQEIQTNMSLPLVILLPEMVLACNCMSNN